MEREAQQLLLTRRMNLTSLQKHAGWKELVEEIGRRKGRDVRAFTHAVIAGEEPENLQRQIDYLRGWEAALAWVMSLPGGAESSLERFLEKEHEHV